ncbi:copper-binding protein [Novosphingobium mathurense]|uniref:copper-binding protein n=1 Tax=Novosphingobium mathurense TaxID=428990 RepID=UPI003CCBADC2
MTAIGFAALLAACGQQPENDSAPNASASAGMSGDMSDMDIPADMPMKMAKGTGTVTAIDKTEGSITIDHAPIPEANWPAMTMAFKAKPELLGGVKVGDEVAFDLEMKDGAGEIVGIGPE